MLPYRQTLTHTRLEPARLKEYAARLAPLVQEIQTRPSPDIAAIASSFQRIDSEARLRGIAARFKEKADRLVVIGSGGSGLSSKALAMLSSGQHTPALHVLDNASAFAFSRLCQGMDLHRTCFLAVSKSGSTVETCMQVSLLLDCLREQGVSDVPERFAAITVPGANPLRNLAESHGIPVLDHAPDLGGRFSILSCVGLLPALFLGLDVEKLLAGAQAGWQANLDINSPAALGAALNYGHMVQGRHVAVFMTYTEQLLGLSLWWRQSWAESLGKNDQGSTPVAALGPADQHSQLQLWLDGPDGKLYTLLLPKSEGKGNRVRHMPPPMDYLNGHSLSDLTNAQGRATAETLIKRGRPLRLLEVDTVDEYTLGALLAHFTLEIVFAGALLSVNPFGQPAVEESKRLTHAYLTA